MDKKFDLMDQKTSRLENKTVLRMESDKKEGTIWLKELSRSIFNFHPGPTNTEKNIYVTSLFARSLAILRSL